MTRRRLILFAKHGTLFEDRYMMQQWRCYAKMAATRYLRQFGEDQYRDEGVHAKIDIHQRFERPWNDLHQSLAHAHLGGYARDFVVEMNQFAKTLFQFLEPNFNLQGSLARLRERGHCVGIVTNDTFANTYTLLDQFQLLDFFEEKTLVTIDDPSSSRRLSPKPSGDGIAFAMEESRFYRKDTVFIGSSAQDRAAARAAGVAYYHVVDRTATTEPCLPSDFRIDNLANLLLGFL